MKITLEEAEEFFRVDITSPSGLRWIKNPNNNVMAGDAAGYLAPKDELGYGPVWLISLNRKHTNVSRVIWLLCHGNVPRGMMVDHMNGIPSDNRIENLCLKTAGENIRAVNRLQSRNTSGYHNVHWYKKKQRWLARFLRKGKMINAGSYKNIEDAARAADAAALKWAQENGEEFRLLNFPS